MSQAFKHRRNQVRRQFLSFILAIGSCALLLIPLMLVASRGGKTGWLPAPGLSDVIAVLRSISGGNAILLALLFIASGWALLLIGTTFFIRKNTSPLLKIFAKGQSQDAPDQWRAYLPITLALLCWGIIPFVGSFIVSQGETRLFSARYMVITVPPLLFLAALSIDLLPWRRILLPAGMAIMLVVASLSVPRYYQSAQVENWRDAVFWLQKNYREGDGMVCYDNIQGCQVSVEYYLRAYPNGVTFPSDAPGSFPWVNYDLTNHPDTDHAQAVDPKALASYSAKHERIFLIVARLDSDIDKVRTQEALNWLNQYYYLEEKMSTGDEVTIYLYASR